MRSIFYTKSIYKPRFVGYRIVKSFVLITDGILSLLVSPFPNITCDFYANFCEWNLRKDIKRIRK
jgi:hypothetical protein